MLRAEAFGSREEDVTKCPSRVERGKRGWQRDARVVSWRWSCVSGEDRAAVGVPEVGRSGRTKVG